MTGRERANNLFAHYRQVALDATTIVDRRGHHELAADFRDEIIKISGSTGDIRAYATASLRIMAVLEGMLIVCDTVADLKDVRPYVDRLWNQSSQPALLA